MIRRFLETALLTMALPLFWGTDAHCTQKLLDRVAVIVNGMPILESEIQTLMHQFGGPSGKEHLDEAAAKNVLIEELLYLGECKSLFQNTDDKEVLDHKTKLMQQHHMSEHQFKATLEAQGLTEKA